VCGFSWGYVFGILMARKEVVLLGFLASAAWLVAAVVGAARLGSTGALRAARCARSSGFDRARSLPHPHPGALSAGSADVPRLHVLRGRRHFDHKSRAAQGPSLRSRSSADLGHYARQMPSEAGAFVPDPSS